VLPFLGVYELEDELKSQFFLVLPYMKNGTLAQWRRKESDPSITDIQKRVKHFFFQPHDIDSSRKMLEVAQGLQYIHSEGVVHGSLCGVLDLKDDPLKC
jgi:serine/threonine protein kinase